MTDGPITHTGPVKFLQTIQGPDHWHNVGATGEPAFVNSWVNYDTGGFQDARFIKNAAGVVFIEGVVKDGTTTIFTLPQGYRPAAHLVITCTANNAFGRFNVEAGGAVVAATGSNTWFAITGSFYVG